MENLVEYCIQSGYVKAAENGTPHSGAQRAALTACAVQPAPTVTTFMQPQHSPATDITLTSSPRAFRNDSFVWTKFLRDVDYVTESFCLHFHRGHAVGIAMSRE